MFLPDYDVSLAQRIMPAADLSEQISTAGTEASGTGNMKLALNGALTIGTLDGANIEIREQVGRREHLHLRPRARRGGAAPARLFAGPIVSSRRPRLAGARSSDRLRGTSRPATSPTASRSSTRLLSEGEPYFVLADFAAYAQAQEAVGRALLRGRTSGGRRAVLNALGMGTFSSDRSIREYAERIWRIKPVL